MRHRARRSPPPSPRVSRGARGATLSRHAARASSPRRDRPTSPRVATSNVGPKTSSSNDLCRPIIQNTHKKKASQKRREKSVVAARTPRAKSRTSRRSSSPRASIFLSFPTRARQPQQRARLTVRIFTHRESERFFFFFFLWKKWPLSRDPFTKRGDSRGAFSGRRNCRKRCKNKGKNNTEKFWTTTTPAFFKKCTRRETRLRRPWRDKIPPKTTRRRRCFYNDDDDQKVNIRRKKEE